MNVNSNWNLVLNYYSKAFSYPYEIVEYLAVRDILKRNCMGYSNYRIAKKLKMKVQYVSDSIFQFFGTYGLLSDLSYSPLAIYKNNRTLESFTNEVNSTECYSKLHKEIIYNMYISCKIFFEYEEELKNYES